MVKDTDANDTPPASCGVKYDRDCLPAHGCVVSAITNMISKLLKNNVHNHHSHRFSPRVVANLQNLIHTSFADISHQQCHTPPGSTLRSPQVPPPLHRRHPPAASHRSRRARRKWNPRPVNSTHTNLHSIWDTEMPEKHIPGLKANEKRDAMKWAEQLSATAIRAGNSTADECTDITNAERCALEWATEANTYVCSYVLKDDVVGVEGKNLAGEYYDGAVPIIDHLVGKAGLRLGQWGRGRRLLRRRRRLLYRGGLLCPMERSCNQRPENGSGGGVSLLLLG